MNQRPADIIASQPEKVDRQLEIERDEEVQHTTQTLSQSFPTTVDDLWNACTQPDRLARWFGPVSGDLRLGGQYEVEDNASGEVLACEPPHSFTVTWEFGGESSQLAVRISPEGERARLTIEHQDSSEVDSEFWTEFGPGAGGVGWDLTLLGLTLYLIAGQDRPEDPEAFADSAPAQDFIRAVSAHWGEASVRAGTPRDDAEAAALRTSAFYLREDAPS